MGYLQPLNCLNGFIGVNKQNYFWTGGKYEGSENESTSENEAIVEDKAIAESTRTESAKIAPMETAPHRLDPEVSIRS